MQYPSVGSAGPLPGDLSRIMPSKQLDSLQTCSSQHGHLRKYLAALGQSPTIHVTINQVHTRILLRLWIVNFVFQLQIFRTFATNLVTNSVTSYENRSLTIHPYLSKLGNKVVDSELKVWATPTMSAVKSPRRFCFKTTVFILI